jgi:hypothetical protein
VVGVKKSRADALEVGGENEEFSGKNRGGRKFFFGSFF